MVELELPYPPSVNHYLQKTKKGVYVKPEVQAFWWQVKCACVGKPKFSGKVAMTVDVWFPDHRKRDLGNLDKCIMDGLVKAGVITDDTWQILADIHWRAMGVLKGGKVVVSIKELE